MFQYSEINHTLSDKQFIEDRNWVKQSLVNYRLYQKFFPNNDSTIRLNYFIECVLSSAPDWDLDNDDVIQLVCIAAEIAELISSSHEYSKEYQDQIRFKAVLLYELAGATALSQANAKKLNKQTPITKFFTRSKKISGLEQNGNNEFYINYFQDEDDSLHSLLALDALNLTKYEQGLGDISTDGISEKLCDVSKWLNIGMSASELRAFKHVIERRYTFSTRNFVDKELFTILKEIGYPSELWSSQAKALNEGMVDDGYESWGYAAPTGTGKTFLASLLILRELRKKNAGKILYIVPSKALVYEVATKLDSMFRPIGYTTIQVTPQIIEPESEEIDLLDTCDIAVLTPEKADLLTRLGIEQVKNSTLIIVDEAHHIESSTRGILLELYLWRIKFLLNSKSRVIFLSAVTPNIKQLSRWLSPNSYGYTFTRRSTRMRAGVYTINNKIGTIKYHDGTTLNVVKKAMTTKRDQLLQLAESLSTAGPVLIVSKGKKTSQNYAEQLVGLKESWGTLTPLSNAEYESPEIQRLDSRIEREIDKSSTLRGLLRYRIVFHHAGLPPRVRISIEDAIRAGYIDFVVATTTLAEGVNFPFSSVVIQSLAFREFPERGKPASYQPVTPRSFWNIAGRAGRPGYDNEGQVVLFGPSLDLDKTHNVIEDYLDPSINKIAPVQSSLATVIKELIDRINNDEITLDDLTHINFKHSVPKKIQGAVNLLRTGIIHAKASSSSHSISNLLNDSYAIQFLNPHEQTIANRLISNQSKLVDEFAADNDDNVVSLLSELGISLGTYVEFKDYVVSLQDWQLEKMSEVIIAGSINFTQAKFIVGPVASRMSELEGSKLGGVLCDVIIDWLRGIQISKIKTGKAKMNSLEDLINVLYSRIQFLLPWGLFVFNHIVRTECENRNIGYHDEILSLSYLVDAGVPNYDALRLTKLDFERVDSTRLSKAYKRVREDIDYDLLGWLIFEPKENLRRIVYGKDHRRIDYDFNSLIDSIKTSVV